MAERNSTLYAKFYSNKYLAQPYELYGGLSPIPFAHTVVSGELGGASAGVSDEVNLCVIPANWTVIAMNFVGENVWASAGINGSLLIGTTDDADRFLEQVELYTAAGGPIAAEYAGKAVRGLPFAGQNYRPTTDTVVQAAYRGANPTVGKTFKGCFVCIPAM